MARKAFRDYQLRVSLLQRAASQRYLFVLRRVIFSPIFSYVTSCLDRRVSTRSSTTTHALGSPPFLLPHWLRALLLDKLFLGHVPLASYVPRTLLPPPPPLFLLSLSLYPIGHVCYTRLLAELGPIPSQPPVLKEVSLLTVGACVFDFNQGTGAPHSISYLARFPQILSAPARSNQAL